MMLKTILVVENESAIREAMEILLSSTYRLTLARNGEEALTKLAGEEVDLLIVDLWMPHGEGEKVLRELRQTGHQLPVITMSADQDRLERTRALGADDVLVKPFSVRALEEKVTGLLAPLR